MKNFGLYRLLAASVIHYRKMTASLLLGVVLTSALITGALVLGDSVDKSLERMALSRTGGAGWVLQTGDRYMSAGLADMLGERLKTTVVPAIVLKGTVGNPGGGLRAGSVQITAADRRFFSLAPEPDSRLIPEGKALVNAQLAGRLKLKKGDEITVSIRKPSSLPLDAPFSPGSEDAGFRVTIDGIIGNGSFGGFSPGLNTAPAPALFLSLSFLEEKLELKNRINTLLIEYSSGLENEAVAGAFDACWHIEDGGYRIEEIPGEGACELRTDRVFIPERIIEAIRAEYPEAEYVFSYFVNSIRKDGLETPYSIVSSYDNKANSVPEDGELVLTDWLAADLKASAGDTVILEYYVINDKRKIKTGVSSFRVGSVVPLKNSAAARMLMPDLPGFSSAGSCSEWKPGVPVDLDRIRDKDEKYWDKYRGIPKAYIALSRAGKIWGNQFGSMTAVRFRGLEKEKLVSGLNRILGPGKSGYKFTDIRKLRDKAAGGSVDFTQLFSGLSFFIIISSLLLTGLLFAFHVENRSGETATLYALGYTKKIIYRLFLIEGALVAAAGSAAGLSAGILYTRMFLSALARLWPETVGTDMLILYVVPSTLFKGFCLSFVSAVSAVWLSLYLVFRNSIRSIKPSGRRFSPGGTWASKTGRLIPAILPLLIAAIFIYAKASAKGYSPNVFFTAGGLLLAEGIMLLSLLISKLGRGSGRAWFTLWTTGAANINRRPGRNLAAAGLLAIGVFLVIAISSNRGAYLEDVSKRSSGTGGYSLFCTFTSPVNQDLNSPEGRKKAGLDEELFSRVKFTGARLRSGDDASCLNPGRAFMPPILGIDPEEFALRGAFSFSSVTDIYAAAHKKGSSEIWRLLNAAMSDGVIPAVADNTVIRWGLGKTVGDTVAVMDETGKTLELKLVAGLADSVFQGFLLISEKNFLKYFPSSGGAGIILVEGPAAGAEGVVPGLSRAYIRSGIEITTAAARLEQFRSVQNSYLSIFLVLGGLGLLLGTIGLSVLVLRNILERRGEMALLTAVGYSRRLILKMLLSEYLFLLAAGVIIGSLSALLAVWPFITAPGSPVPYALIFSGLAIVISAGLASVFAGAAYIIKGDLLKGLREE